MKEMVSAAEFGRRMKLTTGYITRLIKKGIIPAQNLSYGGVHARWAIDFVHCRNLLLERRKALDT